MSRTIGNVSYKARAKHDRISLVVSAAGMTLIVSCKLASKHSRLNQSE